LDVLLFACFCVYQISAAKKGGFAVKSSFFDRRVDRRFLLLLLCGAISIVTALAALDLFAAAFVLAAGAAITAYAPRLFKGWLRGAVFWQCLLALQGSVAVIVAIAAADYDMVFLIIGTTYIVSALAMWALCGSGDLGKGRLPFMFRLSVSGFCVIISALAIIINI